MTLVIRDKHQNMDEEENLHSNLDREMFCFNINKKTFLTCDNFVNMHYEQLEISLKYLAEHDKELLDLLNYYYIEEYDEIEPRNLEAVLFGKKNEKRVTPLHLAMNNERSANIILHYMSMTVYDASLTIRDILHQCVEKTQFL